MHYVYKAKKVLPHSFSFWLFAVLALLLVIEGCYELFLMPPAANDAAPPSQSQVVTLQAPRVPSGAGVPTSLNMGMPGAPTSITSLQAPLTAASVKRFTLTAQPAHLLLGTHATTPAWTFNGTAPGPTLRVRQGDLVIVNLVNHLSFGVTIHWHGVSVPNSADGVAGVTQDAVKPGQTYIYRFIAKDAGTYWYHSHQFSYEETTDGLYGMLVVDPLKPTIRADVDYTTRAGIHPRCGINGPDHAGHGWRRGHTTD
jgi:FtsP/CotA-like multicopper oxidase with cupredoxin domain